MNPGLRLGENDAAAGDATALRDSSWSNERVGPEPIGILDIHLRLLDITAQS